MVYQKTKQVITVWVSNFIPTYTSKRTGNQGSNKNLCINIQSSIINIAKRRKQPKCPTTDKQVNKMEYCGTLFSHKKSEVLIHATTWANLKQNILLNEKLDTKGHI